MEAGGEDFSDDVFLSTGFLALFLYSLKLIYIPSVCVEGKLELHTLSVIIYYTIELLVMHIRLICTLHIILS